MYNRPMFPKIKAIIPEFLVSSTASVANATISSTNTTYNVGANFMCTITATTGVVYVNSLVTATTANGFTLEEGASLDLTVANILSVVAGSTTPKVQAIVWEY